MLGCTRYRLLGCLGLVAFGLVPTNACPVFAQEGGAAIEPNVAAALRTFGNDWPEDRIPYRREEDTESWKTYALTMKRLVAMDNRAVPGLIEACDDDNFQVRALAARVLGYLQAKSSVPKLMRLLSDENATVALHAADSLGQIQDPRGFEALRSARGSEKRGDVLLHVNKSLDRRVPLEDGVVEQILKIDGDSIDSAKVGMTAPDFTLRDTDGEPWTLSSLRGEKSVVLVFIYGDG